MVWNTLRKRVGNSLIISILAIGFIMIRGLVIPPPADQIADNTETARWVPLYASTNALGTTKVTADTYTPDNTENLCDTNSCFFKDTCVPRPDHATCVTDDVNNARLCDTWYIDNGNSCLSATEYEHQRAVQQKALADEQNRQQQINQQQTAVIQAQQQAAIDKQNQQAALLAAQQAAANEQKRQQQLAQQQAQARQLAAQQQAALLAAQQMRQQQMQQPVRRTRAS